MYYPSAHNKLTCQMYWGPDYELHMDRDSEDNRNVGDDHETDANYLHVWVRDIFVSSHSPESCHGDRVKHGPSSVTHSSVSWVTLSSARRKD